MEFRRDGSPLRPLCSEGQVRKPRRLWTLQRGRSLEPQACFLPTPSLQGSPSRSCRKGKPKPGSPRSLINRVFPWHQRAGCPESEPEEQMRVTAVHPPPQMSPAERTSYRRRRPLWASRPRPVLGEREAALCHRLPGRSLQISLVRGGSQSSRSAAAKDRLGAAAPFRTLGENTYLPDNNRYQRTILIITVFGMAGLRLRLQNGSH